MQKIEQAPTVFLTCASFLLALGLVLSGCTTNSEPEPTVHFDAPKMNDSIVGPNVFVKLTTTHFQFSGAATAKRAAAAGAAAAAGTAAYGSSSSGDVVGHIHLFLDIPVGLDVDAVEQLSKSDTVTLTGLTAGKHYLIAEGANANHDDIKGMEDSVAFTVVLH